MPPRPTPYDLVFADIADEPFGRIRAALQEHGADPSDRDTFLMERDVVTLIRELRPEEGLGEAIDQLAALVHHAYLFWEAGRPVRAIAPDRLAELIAEPRMEGSDWQQPSSGSAEPPPGPVYLQLPERRLWAAAVPDEPAEPLDGCFIHAAGEELRVLGVFGLRPERQGFTVVEAVGQRPGVLARPDGSALFSSTLPGGSAAGLHSLIGTEELLELAWRSWTA